MDYLLQAIGLILSGAAAIEPSIKDAKRRHLKNTLHDIYLKLREIVRNGQAILEELQRLQRIEDERQAWPAFQLRLMEDETASVQELLEKQYVALQDLQESFEQKHLGFLRSIDFLAIDQIQIVIEGKLERIVRRRELDYLTHDLRRARHSVKRLEAAMEQLREFLITKFEIEELYGR